MIFYTLKGPGYKMDILNERLQLTKRTWVRFFTKEPHTYGIELSKLTSFHITSSKILFWGRLEWTTTEGQTGSFRFSTNQEMVKKIERYMSKRIEKNVTREEDELISDQVMIAA